MSRWAGGRGLLHSGPGRAGKFEQWVEPEQVAGLATLLAVSRPGYSAFDWDGFYARNPYAKGRVECIETTAVDVSGSELRQRLSAGAQVSGLVPEAVERYIREKGLTLSNGLRVCRSSPRTPC